MRVFFALGLIHLGAATASAQETLYVNAATGNDAVSKANNSASQPWRTIGRAVWGSTNRSSPNGGEAAAAGDTVLVSGGTYSTSEAVGNRFTPVYNPANSGTGSNPITITCVGSCVLGAPNANSPVIGAQAREYIKWYADVNQGHAWQIRAYGRESGSASATEVNTSPDTGPVVCNGTTGCWVEGANVDGGLQTDYTDNWNGFRYENCTQCVARNNTIRNFRNQSNSINGTAFTLYGSPNTIIENNYASNMGTGLIFKDTASSTLPQNGVRVRYNKFEGVDRCFAWSMTGEDRNYVYQNVCANSGFGVFITGGGLANDWIVNNTFYNINNAAVYPSSNLGIGGRFWNNIVVNAARVVMIEAVPMVSATVLDLEHNVYYGVAQFYTGPDGNRTLAGFRSAYAGQEASAPLSVEANPFLVNAAAGDFRLCVGPGNPSSSCTGASPAIGIAVDIADVDNDGNATEQIRAGAFVTNNEVVGASATGIDRPTAPTNVRIIQEP